MLKIDEVDKDLLSKHKFHLHMRYYRCHKKTTGWIHLNRLVMERITGKPFNSINEQIKHLNGDTEDCQRENLFLFTKSERQQRFLGKQEIFVSDEDDDLLDVRWSRDKASRDSINSLWYAKRVETTNGIRKKLKMHRVIMERILGRTISSKEKVDHIDFNGLNNRRENLRLATHHENSTNRRLNKNNKSSYRGVHRGKNGVWIASIGYKGEVICIGVYSTPKDAAIAYDAVARILFGKFFNPQMEHHLPTV